MLFSYLCASPVPSNSAILLVFNTFSGTVDTQDTDRPEDSIDVDLDSTNSYLLGD